MNYSTRGLGRRTEPRRPVTLLLAVVAVIVLLGALQWLRGRDEPVPVEAEMTVISGQAMILRSGGEAEGPYQANETTVLNRGDEIETSPDGKATLTFGQEETSEMAPGTRATLMDHYASAVSRSQVTILALHQGELTTRIPHVLFQGSRFVIETRIATVEAKGTLFHCGALGPERISVRVQEGIVDVSMGDETLSLEAGESVTAELGQPLAAVPWSPAVTPTHTPAPTPSGPAAQPTYTERQKTLFPPVETPTRPGDDLIKYNVQPGDTLSSIGRQYGLTWKDIYEANKHQLSSPDALSAGQVLIIPE